MVCRNRYTNTIAPIRPPPAISQARGVRRDSSWALGIDQTCVWKMFWTASVALVRSCEARSIVSWASSTVTTALSGSLTVPVASPCAALLALSWLPSSEEIASVSAPPKPPEPPPTASAPLLAWAPGSSACAAVACPAAGAPWARPSACAAGGPWARPFAAPRSTPPPAAGRPQASPQRRPARSFEHLQRRREHRLGRLHGGHVGLVGLLLGDPVVHFRDPADVRQLDIALRVGFRVARVIDLLVGRRIGDDLGNLHAARLFGLAGLRQGPVEALRAGLAQDHLLALVGLAVGRFGGVRVGQVLGGHVHAHALGRQAAAGDPDRIEEPHVSSSPSRRARCCCGH